MLTEAVSVPDGGDRRQLLAQVSEWYYVEQLSQLDIAKRLGVSRSSVSRLLTAAHNEGVVVIQIDWGSRVDTDLGSRLCDRFRLQHAIVVDVPDGLQGRLEVGRQAAREAETRLRAHSVMAISYSAAVHETIKAIDLHHFPSLQVVQMTAVEGARNPLVDGWELVRMCADRLGDRYHYLHAPLFVNTPQLRQDLTEDPPIRKCLELAASADLAIVGIGSMVPDRSSLVRAGHLTVTQLEACAAAGSVGYIGAQHYGKNGQPLDELNELTVSLGLRELNDIKTVFGVAASLDKWPGVHGALTGGYLNVLVTTSRIAHAVLAYDDGLTESHPRARSTQHERKHLASRLAAVRSTHEESK